jgi:hypothetical protein
VSVYQRIPDVAQRCSEGPILDPNAPFDVTAASLETGLQNLGNRSQEPSNSDAALHRFGEPGH